MEFREGTGGTCRKLGSLEGERIFATKYSVTISAHMNVRKSQ